MIIAALLSAGLSISFAQSATADAATLAPVAASPTPKKHKMFHAPKLRKGATARRIHRRRRSSKVGSNAAVTAIVP